MDDQNIGAKILDKILLSGVLGICAGVILDSYISVSTNIYFAIVFLGVVCAAFFVIRRLLGSRAVIQRKSRALLFVSIFLFASLIGIVRTDMTKPDTTALSDQIGEKVTVHGIIDAPQIRSTGIQFSVDVGGMSVLVSTQKYIPLAYGDEVEVTGKLMKPDNFLTDQGTEFDYVSYLYKDDILYKMSYANVDILSHGHGNWFVAKLIPLQNWFLESFNRVLPVRQADLLGGLVLGAKQNIDKDFRNDLVTTGTIHIIALSGYNVTIVANMLRDFFVDILGLGARLAAGAGAFCIIIFVIMTGLQSSAIRAGIMALIGIFARGRGRTYDAFRALIFAGTLMVLWNPKYLVYDVSFQLSFLATLGIIFITPVLEQKFARVPKKVLWIIPLREAMSVTLGAQLGVLPFILYKMGTLSIISLPVNILILPAVPFAMGFGTLAGLLGKISVVVAEPITLITQGLLTYITGLVTFFAKVPFASVVFKSFPIWLCLVLYLILVYVIWKSIYKIPPAK